MDNNPVFAPLDRGALMVAALTPVLNQWVTDTVAFHAAGLKVYTLQEPSPSRLSVDACRDRAEGFVRQVLTSVRKGLFYVDVPFDPKSQSPGEALSALPLESLERLSELQRLGLLAGLRLVWPKALSRLDPWMGDPPPVDDARVADLLDEPSSEDPSESSGDDATPSTLTPSRGRRRPGEKCNIS